MKERYKRIERFLNACTQLAEGKYNAADSTISEMLAAIAESRDLTGLFTAVTYGFDYAKAKQRYLRFPAEKGAAHGTAYLPSERDEVLAFVFCVLVELDGGAMRLGDFLLRYFYVDGSYTASYIAFADRMVRPFMNIVRDCFPKVSRNVAGGVQSREEIFSKLAVCVASEQARLATFALREEEEAAATILLTELSFAAKRQDVAETSALLTGYKYFLRYFAGESEESTELFALGEEL
ncbi:MAG: hypothetical protein IKD43_02815 [Clostridia bacterium]|nr:hypothetical protein [Clostridia bacterium]